MQILQEEHSGIIVLSVTDLVKGCVPHVLRQDPLIAREAVQRQAPAQGFLYPLRQDLCRIQGIRAISQLSVGAR